MLSKISKHDANADLLAFTSAKKELQSKSPSNSGLSVLPADILDIIFRFAIEFPSSITALERCCKSFYAAINSDSPLRNSWATLIQRSGQEHILKEALAAEKKLPVAKKIKQVAAQSLNDYRMVPLDYALQYIRELKKVPPVNAWNDASTCKMVITGKLETARFSFNTIS